jgi:NADH:ubiquinone oxidoreductase subunit D
MIKILYITMSFELTETYSLAKIKEALSSPALDRDTARNVINLYRRVKDSPNNEILVTYEKKKGHGRYYPTSGHHQACYQWKQRDMEGTILLVDTTKHVINGST